MRTYKCLTEAGRGVFSDFAWPVPDDGPAAWVESPVDACRSGIHACRAADLPYWLTPALFEIELVGPVEEQALKVVAPRGRLLRRVDGWDRDALIAYGEMCVVRARELAGAAGGRLDGWLPDPAEGLGSPAHLGHAAAAIAEQLGGRDAYTDERARQSRWLVEQLGLD